MLIACLNKRWIERLLRWIIGITFLAASFHKIADPAQFAKTIYGYGLIPYSTINILAIILPFLELVTGILLLIGKYSKAAETLATIMVGVFIVAISINLARGYEFDCGCFSFNTEGSLFGKNFLLIRDIILFAICMYLLCVGKDRKKRLSTK